MKDFLLRFDGEFEDVKSLVEKAKRFVEEIRSEGGHVEAHLTSGHLLGGTKHIDEPMKFADGTEHNQSVPAEETRVSVEAIVEEPRHDSDI